MIFKPELAKQVIAGAKTQTRRPISNNPRSPWFKGGCWVEVGQTYAVCPGRGKPAVGRILITAVRREAWGDIDEVDARAEGFRPDNRSAVWHFTRYVTELYPSLDWSDECWVIEFRVVEVDWAAIKDGYDIGGERVWCLAPGREQVQIFAAHWLSHRRSRMAVDVCLVDESAASLLGRALSEDPRVIQLGRPGAIADYERKVIALTRLATKADRPLNIIQVS